MTLSDLLLILPPCIICAIAVRTFYLNEKRLKSNREMAMSSKLYQDFLLSTLPEALDNYQLAEKKQEATTEFSSRLKDFTKNIRYFKFAHPKIYNSAISGVEEIEEALSNRLLASPPNLSNSQDIFDVLSPSLDKIYKAFLFDLPDDHIDSYFKFK